MNRVTFLLVATIAAFGVALALKWDRWFGDAKPELKSLVSQSVPPLPDVRVRQVPIGELLPTQRYGWRKDLTPAVAEAIKFLASDGKLKDLARLGNIGRTKKVPFELLNELPQVRPFTVADVEAMGTAGRLDPALLATIARDKGIPVEALPLLAEDRILPAKFIGPLEVLAKCEATLLLQELKTVDGALCLPSEDIYAVEKDNRERLIRRIEIHSPTESITIAQDPRSGAWTVPAKHHIKVTSDRMRLLCDVIDGLASAEHRGSARHQAFGVEGDDGRRIVLYDERDAVVVNLRLGNSDAGPARNFRTAGTFVRVIGTDHVYRAAKNFTSVSNVAPAYWADLRFLDIDYAEMNKLIESAERITLEYKDILLGDAAGDPRPHTGEQVRLSLSCVEVEPVVEDVAGPRPAGEAPPQKRKWVFQEPESAMSITTSLAMVDGLARQLIVGRFEDVVGTDPNDAKYGFDDPLVSLEVSLKGGRVYHLKVGAQVPIEGEPPPGQARSRFVQVVGSPFVGTISEYTVRGYQQKPEQLEDPASKAASQGEVPQAPAAPVIVPPDEGGK